jgi:hypothetical protein
MVKRKIKDWGDKKVNEKDYVRLAIIIGVLVLAYFVYVNFIPKNFGGSSSLKIDIIEISADCADCVDLSTVSASFSDIGVEIDDHDVYAYDSSKGQEMIEKYGIEKVPTMIVVSKKVSELGLEGAFDVKENYAVFDMNAPYIELASGKLRGVVDMIEISPQCDECLSLMPLKAQFESMGVIVGSYEVVGAKSVRGSNLIEGLGLDFAPALLISKNLEEYGWIISSIGEALEDRGDYYLFKSAVPPYKDLKTGQVKGLVDITLVDDAGCEECFDVDELKQAFLAMGVNLDNEKSLDISSSEGKKFARRYNITAVPTVVLSKEILDYPQMREVLGQVGTFDEDDQSFVFRSLEQVGEFVEVEL